MTSSLSQAVLTGLEPATSTLTGWRANQLLYRTQLYYQYREQIAQTHLMRCAQSLLTFVSRTPNGIRTRAAALKGRCPWPLDDGGSTAHCRFARGARRRGPIQHRGRGAPAAKRMPRSVVPGVAGGPGGAAGHVQLNWPSLVRADGSG